MSIRYFTRDGVQMDFKGYCDLLTSMTEEQANAMKRVAEDTVGQVWLSTVWLGLDHQYGDGPPLIFESMTFSDLDGDDIWHNACWRYSTEAEALAGHKAIVDCLKRGTGPDEVPLDGGW